jgi:CRISPR-associated protein Cmr3
MKTWLIEPRDPLIARDGRPSALGGRLESLPFPLPSTVAGAARSRLASVEGSFALGRDQAPELLKMAVHGPLLARFLATGEMQLMAPAPLDALMLQGDEDQRSGGALIRRRLEPKPMPPGGRTDDASDLLPIGVADLQLTEAIKEKGPPRLPAFWSWKAFERWLAEPPACETFETLADGVATSLERLPQERRVHLSIVPGERVGLDGAVFETQGLRFLDGSPDRLNAARLALSFRAAEDPDGELVGIPLRLRRELAPLGGERRLARWAPAEGAWPEIPEGVIAAIVKSHRARLILLTPALFDAGALPAWNGGEVPGASGVTARVRGACVQRATVISGWDLRDQRPKPTRRMACAGSVYFLELDGEGDLETWCRSLWLQPVSDREQDRRDGFGLAALGAWPLEEG